MRIAFVLPGRSNSGGVRVTGIVASGLLERGHDVRILYPQPSMKNQIRAVRDRIFKWPEWLDEFAGELQTFKDIRTCHFRSDELIVAVGMAMSYQLGFLKGLSNPKVQYIHGTTPWDMTLMRAALSLPFPKIVVASYLTEAVARYGTGQILGVVNNGVDVGAYFAAVPESERNGVGTIYSSHPAKDPVTTLKMLREISILRPHVPLRVFGAHRRPGQLSDSVYHRCPSVSRARDLYSRSLVWIVASWSEGFSSPALEAMACGCSVVATDCGGPKDIIVDGVNGFLVPVGDSDAILARVVQLLDDAELRNIMRANAHKSIQQFTWDRCIRELEAALDGALTSQPI